MRNFIFWAAFVTVALVSFAHACSSASRQFRESEGGDPEPLHPRFERLLEHQRRLAQLGPSRPRRQEPRRLADGSLGQTKAGSGPASVRCQRHLR